MQGSFGIVDYMYLISSSLINRLKTILNYCLRFKFMYSLFDREYVLVLRVFFMYSLIVRCPSGASTGVHVPTIEKTKKTLTNDMIFRSRTDMLPWCFQQNNVSVANTLKCSLIAIFGTLLCSILVHSECVSILFISLHDKRFSLITKPLI